MWILPIVGYLGVAFGFAFLTLAIASGLYYLSELVEEHTVLTKRLLTQLIYSIVALLLLLWLVDSLPLPLCLLSILSHAIYAANLRRFPFVKLSDPLFLLSCALVAVNHYFWFRHFSAPSSTMIYPGQHDTPFRPASPYYSRGEQASGSDGDPPVPPSFREISAFFGLLVWLVPFALFVSLSASDNVLPTVSSGIGGAGGAMPQSSSSSSSGGSSGDGFKGHKRRRTGLAKQIVGGAVEWIKETGEAGGLWEGEGRGVGRRF